MDRSNNIKKTDEQRQFWRLVNRNANDLNTDIVFDEKTIRSSIKNLLKASGEYISEYAKLRPRQSIGENIETYYKIDVVSSGRIKSFDLEFDLFSLPHILGLANFKSLLENFEPIKTIFKSNYNTRCSLVQMFGIFFDIISKYTDQIVQHDSNKANENASKLNWIKIGHKSVIFLNMKLFNSNGWLIYRVHKSNNKLNGETVLLTKNEIIDNKKYKIYMVCVRDKQTGSYGPKSILMDEINGKITDDMKFISIGGVEYIFESSVNIQKMVNIVEQKSNNDQK